MGMKGQRDFDIPISTMKKCFVLNTPPWHRRVMVAIKLSKPELLKQIKKKRMRKSLRKIVEEEGKLPTKSDFAQTYSDMNSGLWIIYLHRWKNNDEHKSFLVHEIAHVVRDMMKFIGASKEEEAEAYTNEYLFLKICKQLK